MRALCYPGRGEVALVERDPPRPGPGEALLRVAASGLCHTDVDVLHARYGPGAFPVVPGHEFAGTVEAVGDDAAARWRPACASWSIRTCPAARAARAGAASATCANGWRPTG